MLKKGTIVLIPFPFTDLSGMKVRPAVVLAVLASGEDVVVSFISSRKDDRIKKARTHELVVTTGMAGFVRTGLKVDSIITVSKIATLDRKMILGELGSLSSDIISELDKKLKIFFGI